MKIDYKKQALYYKETYESMRKNIWLTMQELRDLPNKEEDGGWADINSYSIWFTLYQIVSQDRGQDPGYHNKNLGWENEQKRS
jgi:hypothetical protein|tara:strand:+ start:316 stop:564 length:249 start_codon:yes stop_codon:yes gene_type:complete